MTTAYLNRIATAVPPHDMHGAFVPFAESLLPEGTPRNLYRRMVRLAAIDHRYSFLKPIVTDERRDAGRECDIRARQFPLHSAAHGGLSAIRSAIGSLRPSKLALTDAERQGITHVIVTCCTGLYAPGLDFEVIDLAGLNPSVERTFIGFMGCYAAINALKAARHIVRSEPAAKVLLLSLELCSLHMQETQDLEQLLAFTVFADGCAAYLVTAEPSGLAIDSFLAVNLAGTGQLITWRIGEQGFDMHLSGQVPGQLRSGLAEAGTRITQGRELSSIDLWAVHPGGRTILDATEQGLDLPAEVLADSRNILLNYGNMSSASVMFVLQRLMERAQSGTSRLRHVLRAGCHRRNHDVPCRLTQSTSVIAPSSRN